MFVSAVNEPDLSFSNEVPQQLNSVRAWYVSPIVTVCFARVILSSATFVSPEWTRSGLERQVRLPASVLVIERHKIPVVVAISFLRPKIAFFSDHQCICR